MGAAMSDCGRGYWTEQSWEDDYGHVYTEREWVSACRWTAVTTFRDECTLCGKVFRYPNTHEYPEARIEPSEKGKP